MSRRRVVCLVSLIISCCFAGACHTKEEYSCEVRLNTANGPVILAQNPQREWYSAPLSSLFGAYETTERRAETQCVDNVEPRLSSELRTQYPDGVVACACTQVDVIDGF